ncbi:MAG: DUF1343 domain-containing protein, partial [Methanobacteriota archaeon]
MKPVPGILPWLESRGNSLKNQRLAVICNQASVVDHFEHLLFYLMKKQKDFGYKITAAFGPQHGIWGHTQDNMIEWESYKDPRFPFPFY